MNHQPIAWREATTLKDIVKNEQHSHNDNHRVDKIRARRIACNPTAEISTKPENVIEQRTNAQTNDEMPTGIGAVGNKPVNEF